MATAASTASSASAATTLFLRPSRTRRSQCWHADNRRTGCSSTKSGGLSVLAVFSDGGTGGDGFEKRNNGSWGSIFDVDDPRPRAPAHRGEILDAQQALEVARFDIQYCDWRARQDLLKIMLLHEKVVEVLNPLARNFKSIESMKKELAELQDELSQAHREVRISEIRVGAALDKLAHVESLVVNDQLLPEKEAGNSNTDSSIVQSTPSAPANHLERRQCRRRVNVSGPTRPYQQSMKNFWFPVAFSSDVKEDTTLPIECFEEPWVVFRGADGKAGCIQNTCAHRACPLDLGTVKEGRIRCPYHGWEYSTDGKCQKMPSTKLLNVRVNALPCVEHEGMVWIWPGEAVPQATLPSLLPPPGFTIHAEVTMEIPVEHGLLLDNLLDLAHAPFTHTTTFARGWSVPSLVRFLTPSSGLRGHWDPYPIDMEFRPPCMVRSTIGISKPGKLEGRTTQQCETHLHQLHVCLPSTRNKTRLLYRMSLDFAPLVKHVPYVNILWRHLAKKVLDEDLRLVLGQQERMLNGVNIWNWPVPYDKLGVRYRLWRDALENGDKQLPFTKPNL